MIYVVSGGGGKTDAFAAIGVTYPAGATCTCSYGGKTLTAKDTSGRALFLVPSAGQWLVKATNGGQEVEDTVSITTQGQVASVTLSYDLILFDSRTGLHSSYSISSWTGYEITSSGIEWTTSNENIRACITPAIDLSEYTSLEVVYSITTSGTGNLAGSIGFQTTSDYMQYSGNDNNNFSAYFKPDFGSTNKIGTIDLSSMSGNYYFAQHNQSVGKCIVHSIILRR